MKSFLILLSCLLFLTFGTLIEQTYVKETFAFLREEMVSIQSEVENETVEEEDVANLYAWWKKQKETLHAFIPHNDIRELDSWFAQLETHVKNKNFLLADACSKVIITFAITIPGTYEFTLDNIF